MADAINHPPHYGGDQANNPYETIKVIEAWSHDWPQGLVFHLGNVIKYVSRAGRKTPDPIPDLRKAQWYLARAIELAERK